jgi:transcriptional regulator with XRE-family HTH domain
VHVSDLELDVAKKPYEDTRLAKYLEQRVLELKPKKTQADIAAEAGFVSANMIAMLKRGSNKVPLDRVPALAMALDCDPAWLLRLALEQTEGDTAARAIVEILGAPVPKNEMGWIMAIREASGDSDPRLATRGRAAIRSVCGK